MPEFFEWLLSVNWWDLVKDIAIPIAAILIPTLIAVSLAKSEREAAERSRYLERRHNAAQGVIMAMAHMVALDPQAELLAPKFHELRGHIALYRAALSKSDLLSGDWLGLKHKEGMEIWFNAHQQLERAATYRVVSIQESIEILRPAHNWAHYTLQTLSGWLAGLISDAELEAEGAKLLSEQNGSRPATG